MAIHPMEEEIVKNYVVKNRQERILWELSSPRKRSGIMWRHFPGVRLFKAECLQAADYMPPDVLEKRLFELSGAKSVYYMGADQIGEFSLKEAVKMADMNDVCIIYCGNGIGYYQGEQEYGNAPRFLLLKQE